MSDLLDLRARLREVIAALNRRGRHSDPHMEAAIAADAAALKRRAEEQLTALDADGVAQIRDDTAHN